MFTRYAKCGCCACSVHAKSGHIQSTLLILASILDSSSLKTQELTQKLWSSPSPLLALKLFLESFYT